MSRPDICLSIGHIGYDEVLSNIKKVALAEIRIDLLNLSQQQIKTIFRQHNNLIATYRSNDYEKMASLLCLALDSGCDCIDIDIETPENLKDPIIKKASKMGKKVIVSYHNYTETPDLDELNNIIAKMFNSGANIAKIACTAKKSSDSSKIMYLYTQNSNLVAFCMGKLGAITRYAAPILGAPFTYASTKKQATAPGQIDYTEIENFLNKHLPIYKTMLEKKLFAVFGIPVLHSKSPQIFNSAFRELNIDAFYTRIRVQSPAEISKLFKDIPIAGASITSPFKEDIIPFLDNISRDASYIGAVNTVTNDNGKLTGHNTDHAGVFESLNSKGINLAGKNCLVLGGGGAARAAVYGLVKNGANVYICNRTYSKAQNISEKFGCKLLDWDNFDNSIQFHVAVSALLPEATPPFMESIQFKYLLDASYKPSATSHISQKMGATIIPGEEWLVYQAMESFKIFWGIIPSFQAMKNGLKKELKKDEIKILKHPSESIENIWDNEVDLLISAEDLNVEQQKSIIDEEIDKSFDS